MAGVAAVRLGEGLADDGRDRLAGRGEHRLALGLRAVTGARGIAVTRAAAGVPGLEQGGDDVACACGGRAGCRRCPPAQLSVSCFCAGRLGRRASRWPRACRGPGGFGGRGPQRLGPHAERGPVRGDQQPGASRGWLRPPRGVERLEVGRGPDGQLFCLAFPDRDRARLADLGRGLRERHHPGRLRHPLDHPGGIRMPRRPVQIRVLGIQVRLAVPLVSDPRGADRPVHHHPRMLLAVLGGHAQVPGGVGDVGAPLFARGPQPQVGLGEDPHHLEPLGERPRLELVMLQGERLVALRPADHRFQLLAQRAEQRVLQVRRRNLPGCRIPGPRLCHAGVHGHRLRSSCVLDATKNRAVAFPVHAPRQPDHAAASAAIAGRSAACADDAPSPVVCHVCPGRSQNAS